MDSSGAWTREQLHRRMTEFGQTHLLAFWDRLSETQRESLARQLSELDLATLTELYRERHSLRDWRDLARRAEPPEAVRLSEVAQRFPPADAFAAGSRALRAGKVAVVIVAGGQGTRLGFNHPKGMFPIGPVSGATLFQILFEQVLAMSRRYEAPIPLCVMTSPATDLATRGYLASEKYFGLPPNDVHLFCQAELPALDIDTGQLLLAAEDRLALAPDGHGGCLRALQLSGVLDRLAAGGIEQLFYCQVDNPLVRICDPPLLGYHLLARSELTTAVVAKRDSADKLGAVVRVDDQAMVIEYSDLPADLAERRDAAGRPVFWAGNVAVHVFDLALLTRVARSEQSLPLHVAHKKVPFINDRGQVVVPSEPNAMKLERFIFDLLPLAERPLVVEIDRAREFAPVKNGPDAAFDTPSTVARAMISLHREWLTAAGAEVAPQVAVEISPLWAVDARSAAERKIAGLQVTEPTYFR